MARSGDAANPSGRLAFTRAATTGSRETASLSNHRFLSWLKSLAGTSRNFKPDCSMLTTARLPNRQTGLPF